MIEIIKDVNMQLNDFIWGPAMLALFLFVGLLFTIRTGVFQVVNMKLWLDTTIMACFKKKDVLKTNDKHSISQFQSLCTALAATMGTGNITGVATAIVIGGPGAIFWMWLSAFLGMMTNFAEKTLGIRYRYKNEKGEWVGGAMVYIEHGLRSRILAVLFCIFCVFASLGMGNMTQANSISTGVEDAFGIPPYITGIIVMVAVSIVIIGGIKRIANVAELIIPFLSIAYLLFGLFVIFMNVKAVPNAFHLIFTEAFRFQSVGGGVMGYGIATAMRIGIARGVFSNEAGLGASVIAHSASDVKEPVVQGMWGIMEVFVDTMVVCTITALAIITTGAYDMERYLHNAERGIENITGTALASAAFDSVLPFGKEFIAISIILFAFATLIGWSFYGGKTIEYILGERSIFPYKVVFILTIFLGSVTSLDLVWSIADTFNGFMAVPNLIAITLLSGQVFKMTNDYMERRKAGKLEE